VVEKANKSSVTNEPFEKELFKLFSQNLEHINTRIPLNTEPIPIVSMMNVTSIMEVFLANVLCIQLPKYHDNENPILHI